MANTSFTKAVNGNSLKRIGCMLLGVGVGTFVSKKLSDTVQTSGVDGISQYSHYIGPAAVAVAGLMAHQSSKDGMLRDVALGASISGASTIVNNVMGRQVVSLNGDVEPMLPGMGGDIPLLPSENYAATHYDDAGDASAEDVPVDSVEGIGSDLEPINLQGIEEAAIV